MQQEKHALEEIYERTDRPFAGFEFFNPFRGEWVACLEGFFFDRRFLFGLREVGVSTHADWYKYHDDIFYCYEGYYIEGRSSPHILTRLFLAAKAADE